MAGIVTVDSLNRRAEPLDGERPVVEVGAQRGHHSQTAVGRGEGMHQAVDEGALLTFAGKREQFLELVDDEHELACLWKQCSNHPVDAPRCGQLVGQPFDIDDRDPPQALGQFLERCAPRQHRRHVPVRGIGDLAAAYPRQQSGADDTRLAGTRPGDEEHKPSAEVVPRQPGKHLVDHRLASEEVGGIGLVEGAQALVRIDQRVRWGGGLAGEYVQQFRHERVDRERIGRAGVGKHIADCDVVAELVGECTRDQRREIAAVAGWLSALGLVGRARSR